MGWQSIFGPGTGSNRGAVRRDVVPARTRVLALGVVAALAVSVTVAAASATQRGSAFVRCETNSGGTVPLVKPRSCVFVEAGSPVPPFGYQQTGVVGLRWQHWGAPTTTATGTFEGNMSARARASVRLSDPRACAGTGDRTYRHLTTIIHAAGYPPSETTEITGC